MFARTVLIAMLVVPVMAEARTDPAASAYAEAAKNYYALRKDPARRKLRHHWQSAARRFEEVARKYPRSSRAPEALYTAALLQEDLSRLSFLEEDWRSSTANYERLLEMHPRHRLADDAALALAKIYLEHPSLTEKARRTLTRSLEQLPRADRSAELKSLLAQLPAAPRTAVTKPKPVPVKPSPVAEKRPAERSTRVALREAFARAVDALQGESEMTPETTPPVEPGPAPIPEETVAQTPPAAVEKALERVVEAISPPADAPSEVHSEPEITASGPSEAAAPRTIRRIVIDPGHGGHDSGAIGRHGTREKDVALAISRKVARLLSTAGIDVVLTRDDDRYLKLEERTRMANAARGDLFISIHCNSAKNRALRGVETYTLNTASDRYSLRLAARENSASEQGMGDLQFILADLNTKANTDESTRLAKKVQSTIMGEVGSRYPGLKNLGTKQALFYVLLGAKMPAILVETSFLSHPEEERRLSSRAYQDELARAISEGVQDFIGDKQRVAKKD